MAVNLLKCPIYLDQFGKLLQHLLNSWRNDLDKARYAYQMV